MFVSLHCDMSKKPAYNFPGLFVYFQRPFLVFRAAEWPCSQYRGVTAPSQADDVGSFFAVKGLEEKSRLQRDFISDAWINSLGNMKPGKSALQNLSEPRYKLSSVVVKAEPASILHKNIKTRHMPFLRFRHCSNCHWRLLAVGMVPQNGP